MKRWLVFCAVMFAWLSGRASAQDTIAQPGHEIEHQARGGEPTAGEEEHGYGAEAVIPGELHEEDRIGDYGQPRWTARRRFPTTRV